MCVTEHITLLNIKITLDYKFKLEKNYNEHVVEIS